MVNTTLQLEDFDQVVKLAVNIAADIDHSLGRQRDIDNEGGHGPVHVLGHAKQAVHVLAMKPAIVEHVVGLQPVDPLLVPE